MKKVLGLFLFVFISLNLFALSFTPFYTGINFNTTMNSYKKVAVGTQLDFMYSLTENLKTGFEFSFSNDFADFVCFSFSGNFGYFFPLSFFEKDFGILFKINSGYQQIIFNETFRNSVSLGLDISILIELCKLQDSQLCLVPEASFGYPFLWKTGLGIGFRF